MQSWPHVAPHTLVRQMQLPTSALNSLTAVAFDAVPQLPMHVESVAAHADTHPA
jgi:hypothetical protein